MSREANYLVFAAEQYRYAKGLTGAQLVELFDKYGVSKFIMAWIRMSSSTSKASRR